MVRRVPGGSSASPECVKPDPVSHAVRGTRSAIEIFIAGIRGRAELSGLVPRFVCMPVRLCRVASGSLVFLEDKRTLAPSVVMSGFDPGRCSRALL